MCDTQQKNPQTPDASFRFEEIEKMTSDNEEEKAPKSNNLLLDKLQKLQLVGHYLFSIAVTFFS